MAASFDEGQPADGPAETPPTDVGRPVGWFDLPESRRTAIERRSWVRAAVLFSLTVLTTFYVGSGYAADPTASRLPPLYEGWIFAVPLLLILLAHEFGHYLLARRHGVATSPPYFIPAPSILGTFGAFISIRSAIHNRRQLLDIGAAGPLAGFVPSVILLAVGYALSSAVPLSSIPPGQVFVFGDSLLTRTVQWLVVGPLPEGYDIMIHPVGLAGWVGLFVTMFNLMPLGTLDGGHVTYALFGRAQWRTAPVVLVGIGLLGVLVEPWWLYVSGVLVVIVIVVALLLRFRSGVRVPLGDQLSLVFLRHAPVANEEPLDPVRRAIGWLCLLIFVFTFLPAPIRLVTIGG